MSSLMAASMVIAPIVAGYLYELNDTIPFYTSSACLLLALVMEMRYERIATRSANPSLVDAPSEK
jgi:hypothetical protein